MRAKSRPAASVRQDRGARALEALIGVHDRLRQLTPAPTSEEQDWREERRQLLEERALLRRMIDEVPDYLFVKDRESRFVIANRAVAADMGRDPDSIIGKTDFELHSPELAQRFIDDELQVMLTGQPMLDREEFVVLPNGEQRWLSTSKVPLKDARGATIGLVGVCRDVTLRKRAEDEVRRLAYFDPLTNLANRVRIESTLKQLAEALEEANRVSWLS